MAAPSRCSDCDMTSSGGLLASSESSSLKKSALSCSTQDTLQWPRVKALAAHNVVRGGHMQGLQALCCSARAVMQCVWA